MISVMLDTGEVGQCHESAKIGDMVQIYHYDGYVSVGRIEDYLYE